jgi:hypothetical protein
MNPLARCLAIGFLLACLACLACWIWLPFREDPRASEEQAEYNRMDALEARSVATLRRIDAKGRVESALLHGRLTLTEAAARFRAIYEKWAAVPYTASVLARFPGQSDGERYCRWVIACIRSNAECPDGAGPVAARLAECLERELEEQLRRTSAISLPELSPQCP